ncbi:MAG: phospho-N-acetylmuramoyl-pentapeptide-transferase [Thermoanaerobaculia bacterium]|jgi:phospho-N-acetylmuramoyl-pentapeptide-transferase
MLYHLLYELRDSVSAFNVFRYITFRTAYAALTALVICFLVGPAYIRLMTRVKAGQYVRSEGPQSHHAKAGTPTMGGILIHLAVVVATLLWADVLNPYVWIVLFVTVAFGVIGFADDWYKLARRRSLGLTAKQKLALQGLVALLAGGAISWLPTIHNSWSTVLTFPFIKDHLDLGWLYLPFVVFVIVGASNAVNLTDGLDGLAIGTTLIAAGTYAILTYAAGNFRIANYLRIAWVPGTGELAVFCGALVGASLGFLWFNAHPAEIFMGDVGSLAIGGAIGCLAVMIKQEILLVLVGGLFVIEALSVIVQVGSFRMTGRRVFRMAPIHHHFELSGWSETKVVVRFWIVALIFAVISLSTLKLR